ncbi:MAG: hypothetical protein Q4A04_07540 [Eubacteriales bacterium]|nr:hypothetical protein [Eubacteriales bacterium]
MKSKEELDALKEEVNKVNEKLCELTPEELEQVNGGLSSLSLPGMVADMEKHGLGNLGGAVATPGGGASQLLN